MFCCNQKPDARAFIEGSEKYQRIRGMVFFFQEKDAVLVKAEIFGLPENGSGFFGFHIHGGDNCEGTGFPNTGSHLDPRNSPHPLHAGDLPPLLYCNGRASMYVRTCRFQVREIIGRTVIVHDGADDFRTQPSGNAGEKIACGVIREV